MPHKKAPRRRIPAPIWGLLVALVLAVGWRLVAPGTALAQHPDPRPGITAAKVLPPSTFADAPAIAQTYAMAAQIPSLLDGLYCHCDCHKHHGHRSLLSCFESEHASGCDICMGEAQLAFRMHQEGQSLQQIRVAIDAAYGNHGG